MSKTAVKILRTGIMVSFLTICTLGVILFLTHSFLVMKILLIMGGIFLLVAFAIWILGFTSDKITYYCPQCESTFEEDKDKLILLCSKCVTNKGGGLKG